VKFKIAFIFIAIFLFIISCASTSEIKRPSWVFNSAVSGKVAGIGISGQHINGKSAQRSLAVKRAIDEIASQLGVSVDNVALIGLVGNSSGATKSIESYSFQTVDGQVVKAVIKDTWLDFQTDELYIWMVTQ
jgi:hypothetical protein